MVFNSLTFLVFFAIVFGLHQLPLPWTVKKLHLLLASYLFYAAWNPPFVVLLIVSAVVDFWLARWVARSVQPGRRRLLLAVSLTLNLGLLGFFKYGQFLLGNLSTLLEGLGVAYRPPELGIVLPLGISFYTFETISYLVDVYRRKIEPWDSFLDYALFLTFFPHLVAGPIVRASDFLPQCLREHMPTSRQLSWGMALLLIGLCEKVVVADGLLAPIVDEVYAVPSQTGFVDAWIGTIAFAGQIFCDFAGYSTCAIGIALCFGFVLNDNFHFPYAAVGFTDFWQRWHMSLSSWLRDYLYIPLGGNRHGTVRTVASLMLTMLLGGLWHGAAWRFVAWGGLHGLYLIGERGLRATLGRSPMPPPLPIRWLLAQVTFLLVCLTWVFFRAAGFGEAFQLLEAMFGLCGMRAVVSRLDMGLVLLVMGTLTTGHWLLRNSSLEALFDRWPWWLRGAALALMIVALILAPGDDRAFIYFQF